MTAPSLPTAPAAGSGGSVVDEIAAERRRQIAAEGWTPQHDDLHSGGQIAMAAAAYADHSWRFADAHKHGLNYATKVPSFLWPWDRAWWKPKNPRADLIRAAALIVAEVERLDRKAALSAAAPEPAAGGGVGS